MKYIPVVEEMKRLVGLASVATDNSGLSLLERIQAADLAVLQESKPGVTASKIQSIRFEFGHPVELLQTLKERSQNPSGKMDMWPMVMLFTDFPEQWTDRPVSYKATVTLQMVIAYCTSTKLKASDRLEKSFKPILYPIYEELLNQIDKSAFFVLYSKKQIPHRKWDRYYWGRSGLDANVFNDPIDAIEIQDLTLKINY